MYSLSTNYWLYGEMLFHPDFFNCQASVVEQHTTTMKSQICCSIQERYNIPLFWNYKETFSHSR